MLLFGTGPDSSSTEAMSEGEDDDTENDSNPVGGDVENPISERPSLLQSSTYQKWDLPYLWSWESVEKELSYLQGRNSNPHALHTEYIWKRNMVIVNIKIYRLWSCKILREWCWYASLEFVWMWI